MNRKKRMNTNDTTIRILVDQADGTTIKAGSVEASDGGEAYYVHPALAGHDTYRAGLTIALLQWVTKLNDWADQQEETE